MRIFLFFILLIPVEGFCQKHVAIENRHPWVANVEYREDLMDTIQTGGYSHLLQERQFNLQSEESYFRRVLKIRTEKGLEPASTLAVNFDPSFQRISFHTIKVVRNGKVIDKTISTKIEIIRREENMDRLLYDRSLDAVINLTDTQVGDIIEYSYSITGFNPIFNGRWAKALYFNYEVPIDRIYTRVVAPTTMNLDVKLFNNAKGAVKTFDGNNSIYTWDLKAVPALLSDDAVPTWYDGYNNIEISQYESWRDVAQWAIPLYSNRTTSSAIREKVNQIKSKHSNLATQINACIEFVQDEIRYLGFEGGIQGFKPNDPSKVLDQRFGDCKDKSLLLTFMLKELGIESHPALVSTTFGKTLDESLPSPTRFNHCIVTLSYNDSSYWIDPTITLQRGSLKLKTCPAYHHALIIANDTETLVKIPHSTVKSATRVTEDFSVDTIGGSARMMVNTIYTGDDANSMRNYWKSASIDEITKTYADYYSSDYPDIRPAREIIFNDDEDTNTLEAIEQYFIPQLWDFDSATSRYSASFYARVLSGHLIKPTAKSRRTPVSISYPVSVNHRIVINLPEPWSITRGDQEITSDAFRYSYKTSYADNVITIDHTYESLRDHISPTEIKDHVQKIDAVRDNLSYVISYTTNTVKASKISVPFVVISVFVSALLAFGLKALYRYDPRAHNYQFAYDDIGGLLFLPMIGLFLLPFVALYHLVHDDYFNAIGWRILTDSSYGGYDPARGTLIVLEMIFYLFMISGAIFLIVIMTKRRTSFPILMSWFLGIRIVFVFADSLWVSALDNTNPIDNSSFFTMMVSGVWLFYFLLSERVKGTFRERLESA